MQSKQQTTMQSNNSRRGFTLVELPVVSKRKRAAFTLVELLVVIGIIAILISILIPTLRQARRQANLVQCSSNMKQVAQAMMMYIQDNKGAHPPCGIPPLGTNCYPDGFWWATELVKQGYCKSPGNVYPRKGMTPTQKVFNRSNAFRCPEGIEEAESELFNSNDPGSYPTHAANNRYTLLYDTQAATAGFGVPSWYMLNSRVANTAGAMDLSKPSSKGATPFSWFNGTDTTPDTLRKNGYRRTWGLVKKASELIMIVEASNPNWYDQNASTTYPGVYLRRLGARHGKKTRDGANAYTNFAFFDGHVALFATEQFNQGPKEAPEWPADKFYRETIFWLQRQ